MAAERKNRYIVLSYVLFIYKHVNTKVEFKLKKGKHSNLYIRKRKQKEWYKDGYACSLSDQPPGCMIMHLNFHNSYNKCNRKPLNICIIRNDGGSLDYIYYTLLIYNILLVD